MSIMEKLEQEHFENAGEAEQYYLLKEPNKKTAELLLNLFAETNLTVVQIKGCLDYTRYLLEFRSRIPKEK